MISALPEPEVEDEIIEPSNPKKKTEMSGAEVFLTN